MGNGQQRVVILSRTSSRSSKRDGFVFLFFLLFVSLHNFTPNFPSFFFFFLFLLFPPFSLFFVLPQTNLEL